MTKIKTNRRNRFILEIIFCSIITFISGQRRKRQLELRDSSFIKKTNITCSFDASLDSRTCSRLFRRFRTDFSPSGSCTFNNYRVLATTTTDLTKSVPPQFNENIGKQYNLGVNSLCTHQHKTLSNHNWICKISLLTFRTPILKIILTMISYWLTV